MNVLVVTAVGRLADALKSNFDDHAAVQVVSTAEAAQQALFDSSWTLAFVDFEAVNQAPSELLVTIDNIMQKEHTVGVLLTRKASPEARQLHDQLGSLSVLVDLSQGRAAFDEEIAQIYRDARKFGGSNDLSVSTDRLVRHEVDLPAIDEGDLLDTPLPRLLYTLLQRKESGVLRIKYSTHELVFGFEHGGLISGSEFDKTSELVGAFSWSHGKYAFEPKDVSGEPVDVLQIIAEGCRDHTRQRTITEVMSEIMRRYPVPTNLWEERKDQFTDYEILHRVMEGVDGSTNWETVLSSLGQQVTDGFRAAFFATQLDLVHTITQPGIEGAAVQYSREVRRARQRVDQAEVEKTKAFRASSGEGRSQLERELSISLGRMKDMTPHEVFGVWEGCGRRVVQDRFYVLVKEHHPDVYGGNTSGGVRTLAQDIFILIKDSYQKLLALEKEQTVAPPESAKSEPNPHTQKPGRKRADTPRLARTTSSGTGTRTTSSASTESTETEDDKPDVDVKSRLSSLSGYRRKQKHRQRLKSYNTRSMKTKSETDTEALIPEATRIPTPEPEPEPEPDPEEVRAADRQAKLDHLLRRAQKAKHPDGHGPARDFFNKGYEAYKEKEFDEAYDFFEKAYELNPQDGLILTFYGYMRFLKHPNESVECEEILRSALQTGNRQSAPDACLFIGHILKARGDVEGSLKYYQRALRLNPGCHEAERELRLAEKRDQGRHKSDPGGFIKNLFKK